MGGVKKKCCKSKPTRCSSCPVVAKRLSAVDARSLRGKELRRAIKDARRY